MIFRSKDALTQLAISKGILNWKELLETVREIPYGRNASRTNFGLVLEENRGTCSTKHALAKQLADLNGIANVDLVLGMYRMKDENTPGIQLKSMNSNLEYIPEAHCYLRVEGVRVDVTTRNSSIDRITLDILSETTIEPKQVGKFKVDYHQEFIKQWISESNLNMNFDQVWNIREQCIRNLANK